MNVNRTVLTFQLVLFWGTLSLGASVAKTEEASAPLTMDCARILADEAPTLPEAVRVGLIYRLVKTNKSHTLGHYAIGPLPLTESGPVSSKTGEILGYRGGEVFSKGDRYFRPFIHEDALWSLSKGKGDTYRSIRPSYSQNGKTLAHISSRGLIPKGAKVFFLLLHGGGASVSQAGTMTGMLRVLTTPKLPTDPKMVRNDFRRTIQANTQFVLAGGEAIDHPAHHLGPDGQRYQSLSATLDFLDSEINGIRSEIKRAVFEGVIDSPIPIVVVARSFSAGLIFQYTQDPERRKKIGGVVLQAPEHADPDKGFDQANQRLLELFQKKTYSPNWPGFVWAVELAKQMDWHEKEDPFNGVPTLTIVGKKDPERISDAIKDFERISNLSDQYHFHDLAKGGHFVFSEHHPAIAVESYRLFYDFVNSVIESH